MTVNGDVYSWGDHGNAYFGNGFQKNNVNAYGRTGSTRFIETTPTKVASLDSINIISISSNTSSSFAIAENNDVYAWGADADGKLGLRSGFCSSDAENKKNGASSTVCYTPKKVNVIPKTGFSYIYEGAAVARQTFEEKENSGQIINNQKLSVFLLNNEFTSSVSDGSDFTTGTHYTPQKVPTGLTMKVTKNTKQKATITFTGTHNTDVDVNDIQIDWLAAAVKDNTSFDTSFGRTKSDISIDFGKPKPPAPAPGSSTSTGRSANHYYLDFNTGLTAITSLYLTSEYEYLLGTASAWNSSWVQGDTTDGKHSNVSIDNDCSSSTACTRIKFRRKAVSGRNIAGTETQDIPLTRATATITTANVSSEVIESSNKYCLTRTSNNLTIYLDPAYEYVLGYHNSSTSSTVYYKNDTFSSWSPSIFGGSVIDISKQQCWTGSNWSSSPRNTNRGRATVCNRIKFRKKKVSGTADLYATPSNADTNANGTATSPDVTIPTNNTTCYKHS